MPLDGTLNCAAWDLEGMNPTAVKTNLGLGLLSAPYRGFCVVALRKRKCSAQHAVHSANFTDEEISDLDIQRRMPGDWFWYMFVRS